MLEILLSKLDTWTQETSDQFHNNLLRSEIPGRYIWEFDNDGMFLYRDVGSYYFSNKGKVYILTKWSNYSDWDTHLLFFKMLEKNKICRIDIPIVHKQINFKNSKLFYKEFIRPNNEFGRDYHLDILDNKVDKEYFKKFINDASIIIGQLKQFSLEENKKLPEVGISLFKRMIDSKGVFWIDFKRWNQPVDNFINISLQNLNTAIFYLEYNNFGNFDRRSLLQEAEEKWNLV